MRLLETATGKFRWVKDPRTVRYAILSHVWSKEGDRDYVPEQTYQQVCQIQIAFATQESVVLHLCKKIQHFCQVAKEHGLDLGWADTCCIDKTNHAELSEAITSMYSWYCYAEVCYVILPDVSDSIATPEGRAQFRGSRWHGRGWTLQELLAPRVVLFLNDRWDIIGSKRTLAYLITQSTGIDHAVLTYSTPLHEVSVATRMSWAARRETTYVEDEAYSLMGIFGIYISPAYGEKQYAFIRFQEELMKRHADQSLFVWGNFLPDANIISAKSLDLTSSPLSEGPSSITFLSPSSHSNLLAWSPKDFKFSTDVIPLRNPGEFANAVGCLPSMVAGNRQVFTPTPHGIYTNIHLFYGSIEASGVFLDSYLALLPCKDIKGRIIALLLHPQSPHDLSTDSFFVGSSPTAGPDRVTIASSTSARVTTINPDIIRKHVFTRRDIYVHSPRLLLEESQQYNASIRHLLSAAPDGFEAKLTGWSSYLLALQGYKVEWISLGPEAEAKFSRRIQISRLNQQVVIDVRRCMECHRAHRPGALRVDVDSHVGTGPIPNFNVQKLPHSLDDLAHVYLWDISFNTATRMIQLNADQNNQKHVTLGLAVAARSRDGLDSSVRTSELRLKSLQLSIELSTPLPRSLTSLLSRPSTPLQQHLEPVPKPEHVCGAINSEMNSRHLAHDTITRTSSPIPSDTYWTYTHNMRQVVEDSDVMIVRTCLIIRDISPHFPFKEPLDLIRTRTSKTPYAWTCIPNNSNPQSIVVDFRDHRDAKTVKESLTGYYWQQCLVQVDYRRLLAAPIDFPLQSPGAYTNHSSSSTSPPYSTFCRPFAERGGTTPSPIQKAPSSISTAPLAPMPLQGSVSPKSPEYLAFTPTNRYLQPPSKELDLNDPWVLETYIRITMFQNDPQRPADGFAFPSTLSSAQRYTVHLLAQKLGASAESAGSGTERCIVVRMKHSS